MGPKRLATRNIHVSNVAKENVKPKTETICLCKYKAFTVKCTDKEDSHRPGYVYFLAVIESMVVAVRLFRLNCCEFMHSHNISTVSK